MPEHFYVYPAYLARGRSRSQGRRLREEESVLEVTSEEIVQAAKRLGCRAEVEPTKQFPRDVPSYLGRVKVTKASGFTKTKLLRAVAADLPRPRALAGKH